MKRSKPLSRHSKLDLESIKLTHRSQKHTFRSRLADLAYKLHLKLRYPHDIAWKKVKWYRKLASNDRYGIKRGAISAMVFVSVVAVVLSNLLPQANNQKAMAAGSIKRWSNGDFTTKSDNGNVTYTSTYGSMGLSVQNTTMNVGTQPIAIAVNSTTNKIYVANWASNTVSVIDGGSNTVTATITVGNLPSAIAVNSTTNKIYVANRSDNNVKVIDGTNDTVTNTIDVTYGAYGAWPMGLAVNESTNQIFVANSQSNVLKTINGATNAVTNTSGNQDAAFGIAVNPSTSKLYWVNNSSTNPYFNVNSSVNLGSWSYYACINTPKKVAVKTSTNTVYIAGNNGVQIFNGASNTFGATIAVSGQVTDVAFNPSNNKLYATRGNLVDIIDTTNNTVTSTIGVGTTAQAVAVNTTTNKAYVANNGSNNVSMVSDTITYNTPGVINNLKVDAGVGKKAKWSSISWTSASLPSGSTINFKARTSEDGAVWSDPSWSGAGVTQNSVGSTSGNFDASSISALANSRFIEIQVTLASDGNSTPSLTDFTVGYDTLEDPSNSNITMYKSDGTTLLKTNAGADVTAGNGAGYTNEQALVIKATGLTCGTTGGSNLCTGSSTGRKPEVEVKPVGTAFDGLNTDVGTSTTSTGEQQAGQVTVPAARLATMNATGYHFRMRIVDDQGRQSGWTNYASDATAFTVEQANPTLTSVSINSGAQYVTSTTVTLTLTAADTGGSNLSQMRFSNDGTSWSAWEAYNATKANYTLSAGDGAKTVYAQVRDNAGNVNGKTFTSQADWTTGTTISNLDGAAVSGDLKLLGNSGLVTPDFGSGADGDATITSGSVTIQALYENDSVTGVTTSRGAGKGLNKGAGTYNPSTGAVPNFNNFTINSGATLATTAGSGSTPGVKLEFKVKATLTIQSTGKIDASGMGYLGGVQSTGFEALTGYGPGGATNTGGGPSGASYGGLGGNSPDGSPISIAPPTYTYQQNIFGSGGGTGPNGGLVTSGGKGGGAIKIQATSFGFAGQILSNGANGSNGTYHAASAGSGGSIYLIFSNVISNTGTLSANGGNGGSVPGYGNIGGSGAGGGRIIVQSPTTFSGNVLGGAGGSGGGSPITKGLDGNANPSGIVNYSSLPYPSFGTLGETGTALSWNAGANQKWSALSWSADALTSGQAVKFMVSTDGATWKGPDGNAGNWTSNFLGQAYGGSAYNAIPASLANSTTLYIKVRLESSGNDTPVLHDLSVQSAAPSQTATLDTTAPTGTVTLKDASTGSSTYAKAKAVTVVMSPTESGSGMASFQLSNDGVTWGTTTNSSGSVTNSGTWGTWDPNYSSTGYLNNWYLNGADGSKKVYVKYKDNAGNIGGISPDSNYIAGRSGSALDGKYVYNRNLAATDKYSNGNDIGTDTLSWKTINSSCTSPQCAVNGPVAETQAGYTGKNVLVADNSVDFNPSGGAIPDYPARDACKALGGRLPTLAELSEMDQNKSTYGNNFSNPTFLYWSEVEYSGGTAFFFGMGGSGISYGNKAENMLAVRCVAQTNQKLTISATITLDTVAPTAPAAPTFNAGQNPNNSGNQTLNWTTFSDTTPSSGFKSYTLQRKMVTPTPGSYVDVVPAFTDVATLSYADNSNLSAGTYVYHVIYTDNAGNTGTTADSATLTVDTSNPTISSVSINSGAQYINSNAVTLSISATDPGTPTTGVTLMQFSNDNGATWGKTTNSDGTVTDTGWANYATTYSWNLTRGTSGGGSDGSRTVLARVKDAATNISNVWSQQSTVDFAAGVRGSDVGAGTNSIVLLKANGVAVSSASECASNYVSGGVCANPWISGRSGSVLNNKYVYNRNLGPTDKYSDGLTQIGSDYVMWRKTSPTPQCSGPQCLTGFETAAGYTTEKSLVFDNSTDFALGSFNPPTYPARDACKVLGGRLPTIAELNEMYDNSNGRGTNTYGTFSTTRNYWAATTAGSSNVASMAMQSKTIQTSLPDSQFGTRCVADSISANGGPGPAGTFVSSAYDYGYTVNPTVISWSTNVVNGVKFQIASNNDNATWNFVGPNNNAGTYYDTIAQAITSEHYGHRYFKYKAFLSVQGGNYPTLSSVTINAANPSQQVILDTQVPTGSLSVKDATTNNTSFAKSTSVIITPNGSDLGGSNLYQMQFSNDGSNWSAWEAYSASPKAWTLSSGSDGSRKVYVKYKDNAGNIGGDITETTYLTNQTVNVPAGITSVAVVIKGAGGGGAGGTGFDSPAEQNGSPGGNTTLTTNGVSYTANGGGGGYTNGTTGTNGSTNNPPSLTPTQGGGAIGGLGGNDEQTGIKTGGSGGNGGKLEGNITVSPGQTLVLTLGQGGAGGTSGWYDVGGNGTSGGYGSIVITIGVPISTSITLDTANPTTAGAIAAGTTGTNGWYTSDVTYTLTPTDATSAVANTSYCTDTAGTCTPGTPVSGTNPVNVNVGTESATVHVRWTSTDNAGNVQAVQDSGIIKVDKSAPKATIAFASSMQSTDTVNLTTTFADAVSTVSNVDIEYKVVDMDPVNPGTPKDFGLATWQEVGTDWGDSAVTTFAAQTGKAYKFRIRAKNNAGLIGSGTTEPGTLNSYYEPNSGNDFVVVDTTAPMATISYNSGTNGFQNNTTISLTILQGDLDSGIADGDLEYKEVGVTTGVPGNFAGATWQEVGTDNGDKDVTTFSGRSGYAYMFRYKAKNNAGLWASGPSEPGTLNSYAAPTNWIGVDTDAPTASVSVTPMHSVGPNNYVKTINLKLVLNAGDTGGSTLATYELSDNGTDWSAPTNISTDSFSDSNTDWILTDVEGTYTKYIRVTDVAGNVSVAAPGTTSIAVIYDKTAPDAALATSPTDGLWQKQSTLSFGWIQSASLDVDHYEFYVDREDSEGFKKIGTDIASTENAATEILPVQKMLHWYIRTYDKALNYTNSNVMHIGWDNMTPSLVLNPSFTFTASTNVSDRITLNWPAYADDSGTGSPAKTYTIERIKYGFLDTQHPLTQDWSLLSADAQYYTTSVDGSVHTFSQLAKDPLDPADDNDLTKLDLAIKYTYRIKVADEAGNASSYLLSSTGLTDDSFAPNPGPKNVKAAFCDGTTNNITGTVVPRCSDTANVGFEIALTWDGATDTGVGVTGYKIYRKALTDSNVGGDFTLVGYLDVATPGSPVETIWYDNDVNNLASSYHDTFRSVDTVIKPSASPRLNDSTAYFYRVTAIDANGNETKVVTDDGAEPPIVTNENEAASTTPDVTAPPAPAISDVVAVGLDGQADDTDPKQEIDVTWPKVIDAKAPGRIPEGTGSGVDHYNLYYATSGTSASGNPSGALTWNAIGGNISPNNAQLCSTDNGTKCTYPHTRLNDISYYYYRLTATDAVGRTSVLSTIEQGVSGSSALPNTPTQVSAVSVKGDANTNTEVGHKVSINFVGGKIVDAPNRVTGYEVYRTTSITKLVNGNPVNLTPNDWLNPAYASKVYTISNLNIPHDTIDPGDTNCGTTDLPYGQGTVHFRCFKDTIPADATTYYYKIRTVGINATPTDHAVYSVFSATANDTVPDATAPMLPLELKVKDIHDDGTNFKRNIVTWARISEPTRNGVNDFKEYRIYRSTDGLVWNQLLNEQGNNPLRSQDPKLSYAQNQEISIATNYYMDLIPISEANQYYYYYVTAADDSDEEYKYPGGNVINWDTQNNRAFPANESKAKDTNGTVRFSVSLNPAIARPTITNIDPGVKARLADVGVSTALIQWTVDQPTDSVVEYKVANPVNAEEDKWVTAGDRAPVATGEVHSVKLVGLKPNTRYLYKIISRNSLGNEDIIGDDLSEASLLPSLTTRSFSVAFGDSSTTTSTAEITWTTNLDASSAFIEYTLQRLPGDDPQGGTAGVEPTDLAASPRNHKVVVKGLRSNRTYTYKVKSISTDGFVAETDFLTFTTRNFDKDQFTIAPSSSNVAERNITSTTAQIVWQTSIPTTSAVDYATIPGIKGLAKDNIMSVGNNDLTLTHVVKLEGLVPGTRYYYQVRGKDANEVEYTSQESSFVAVLKPRIENMRIKDVKPYEVTISWDTNVETETIINWGKTTGYGEKRGTQGLSKVHEIKVTGLEDNTEYHYQVLAHDEMGNEVADTDRIVRTPLDTEGPKIENVKTDILPMGSSDTTGTVVISWTTNKPATTMIEYDEGIIAGRYTKSSVEDKTLNLSHTVIIKDLRPASSYHYRIVSKDRRNNATTSNDYTFVTPSQEKSILQLILKSLEETFAWTRNMNQFFGGVWKRFGAK